MIVVPVDVVVRVVVILVRVIVVAVVMVRVIVTVMRLMLAVVRVERAEKAAALHPGKARADERDQAEARDLQIVGRVALSFPGCFEEERGGTDKGDGDQRLQ